MVPLIMVYMSALNQVFSLTGKDLADSKIITRMFSSLENNYLPREIKPPEQNLAPVLKRFTFPTFEPRKLSSDKHLTWKDLFCFPPYFSQKLLVSCMASHTDSDS